MSSCEAVTATSVSGKPVSGRGAAQPASTAKAIAATAARSVEEGKNGCMERLASVTGLYLIGCTRGGDKGKPRVSINYVFNSTEGMIYLRP